LVGHVGPRRQWRDVVSQDLGIGEIEWCEKARSRAGWRAQINSRINVYDEEDKIVPSKTEVETFQQRK